MPVQFKLNEATGEISDVKLVRMPRDVRAYNETYYARTKTFRTCEFCNKSVGSNSIYQHKKSQKCLAIQLKKKKEEEKQKKKEEKQKKEEEEKQKKEEEEKQQQQPEPETRESLTKKIIAMCKQLENLSLMD
jgi:septum formation inhibitor MinC